jgi:uncharacterized membrane protein
VLFYARGSTVDWEAVKDQKFIALIAYVLNLLSMGVLTGLLAVVAVVINYLRRGESVPFIASHHRWMIHTFWWSLLWFVLGSLTTFIGIGFVIMFLTAVWWLYRQVRGLVYLNQQRAMPV